MKSGEKKNESIEAALNSIDGLQRATPSPYLLTRINQKLAQQPATVWEKLIFLIGKPAVALPGLALILVLNVLAIVNENNGRTGVADQTTSNPGDEYSFTIATIYDAENP